MNVWSNLTPGHFLSGEGTPVRIECETGWTAETVWIV